jgi:clan AA aspartic protease (TIGR02281 family)
MKRLLIQCLAGLILGAICGALIAAFCEDSLPPKDTLITTAFINRQAIGTFIIDTGSTYAVITPELASKLGVIVSDETPRVSILTANGVQACPRVTLSSIQVGPVTVHNVAAVVKRIDDDPLLAGLLGMSFLSQVDLRINKGQLSIEKAGN